MHFHIAKTKKQMQNTLQDKKMIIKLDHYSLEFHK